MKLDRESVSMGKHSLIWHLTSWQGTQEMELVPCEVG